LGRKNKELKTQATTFYHFVDNLVSLSSNLIQLKFKSIDFAIFLVVVESGKNN